MGRKKAPILLCSCEKYEEDVLLSRATRRNQRQPGEEVPDSQEHGALRSTNREREHPVFFFWAWTLLCAEQRGNTAKHVFECEESLIEPAVRCKEVN